jgi:hypothetical protein
VVTLPAERALGDARILGPAGAERGACTYDSGERADP